MTRAVEKVKAELSNLKRIVKRIEEKRWLPLLRATCGKPLSLEFKLCTYAAKAQNYHPRAQQQKHTGKHVTLNFSQPQRSALNRTRAWTTIFLGIFLSLFVGVFQSLLDEFTD